MTPGQDPLEQGRPRSSCQCTECTCPLHTYPGDDRCVWCRHGDHGIPRPTATTTQQLEFTTEGLDNPKAHYRKAQTLRPCALYDCHRTATWQLWIWPPNRTLTIYVCPACLEAQIRIRYALKRPKERHASIEPVNGILEVDPL